MPTATSNGRFLYVDDSFSDQCARVTGYESMTSISSGISPFPSLYQVTNARLFLAKYFSATITPIAWFIIATDKLFHIVINTGGSFPPSTSSYTSHLAFGDIVSFLGADAYNTIIVAQTSVGYGNVPTMTNMNNVGSQVTGHFMARAYTQLGTSQTLSKSYVGPMISGTTAMGTSGLATINPVTGEMYFSSLLIGETGSFAIRGILPGVITPMFGASTLLTDGDQISNITGFSGKTYEVKFLSAGGSYGIGLFEISNTW
jgi:hypothetical protein